MNARAGLKAAVPVVAAMALLAACSQSDHTEIATFTDEHGRACTAAVVVDSEDGDREVQSLDCDYPPEGREPGPSGYSDLP
ncbi:hypothetical protein [Streptomyces litchfieldiae]|uniref:Secreted protein n=1 Tax=Streptomyces litchfieldiae TaxID=3075543 RepID=A0ABU2MYP1_9ACTN|nr:hypothetical protein [Streptomyces sp. DSM 44938]MDT0346393.1 hypothetical protein [Streptomyces sp. DSM 44938]